MPGCKPLTDSEIAESLSQLHSTRDKCLFILGLRTGFRISELLSIKVSQVLQYGEIVTHITVNRSNMKGSKSSRTVALHNDARTAIKEHIDREVLSNDDFLFKGRLGSSIKRWQAWNILKRAFNRAEITGRTGTHSMRKSFAVNVYSASNKDLVKTQKAMGHKSMNSTVSYLDVDQPEIDDLITKLK